MAGAEIAPELSELAEQFENSKKELTEILAGLSEEIFNRRPPAGGWSIAECADHLVVTGKDYTKQIENGLKKIEQKRYFLKGPYKLSWLGKSFIKSVEPPVKRKFKNPARWTPDSNHSIKELSDEYTALQDRYIDLLKRSKGLDIMRVKLPSPATSLLRFSIYEMFHVNAAHQRRHLWQANNVKNIIAV
jgi:hypothetical protein